MSNEAEIYPFVHYPKVSATGISLRHSLAQPTRGKRSYPQSTLMTRLAKRPNLARKLERAPPLRVKSPPTRTWQH